MSPQLQVRFLILLKIKQIKPNFCTTYSAAVEDTWNCSKEHKHKEWFFPKQPNKTPITKRFLLASMSLVKKISHGPAQVHCGPVHSTYWTTEARIYFSTKTWQNYLDNNFNMQNNPDLVYYWHKHSWFYVWSSKRCSLTERLIFVNVFHLILSELLDFSGFSYRP